MPSDFILSSDFGFGCAGVNKSPHLKWSSAPAGTKSFAGTCHDPPTGSGFRHWPVVNISASASELVEEAGNAGGTLPAGALQTRSDFGAPGYGGPCSPEGDHPHRYLFTVFAVATEKLNVQAETSAASASTCISNTLAKAQIMGLFKREAAGHRNNGAGSASVLRVIGSNPLDIRSGNADVGQFAVAKMGKLPPDCAIALPSVEEAGDRCKHIQVLSPAGAR